MTSPNKVTLTQVIKWLQTYNTLEPHYNTHFGVHSDISVIIEQPHNEGIGSISSGSHPCLLGVIKTKNLAVEKERSIDSKAQKKTNKITKFMINAFL